MMTRYEILQIIFAALILTTAIIAACVYGCQLSEMQKATIAATKAADAAKESSDTAKRSIEFARETAHLDQRAWVSIFHGPLSEPPKVGQKFRVSVPIKNTGKTFARKVTVDGGVHIVRADAKPNFAAKAAGNQPVTGLLLAPNGEYTLIVDPADPWSDDQNKAITSGQYQAFVWGCITYYDVFDCVHWTIYCCTLNPDNWGWDIYSQHNDADNDKCEEAKTK
jgi:hypothetical protein